MAGRFRYVFDDFYELSDEPLGWEDVEIVIKRNEDDYGGLFLTYMSEFTFWGDGYSYVNQQIQNLGYCFSIQVKITYQCNDRSGYETVFEGFINIKTAEIDNENCTVKANIERDDIYTSFLQKSSTEVNIGRQFTFLPDGTDITLDSETLSYHKIGSGNGIFFNLNNAYGFRIVDTMNFLTAIYTQNRLPVISDFFTLTHPTTEAWEIEFTGDPVKSGDTLSVTIKNYFGIVFTKSQAFTVDEDTTIEALGFKLINEASVAGDIQASQVQLYFDSTSFANVDYIQPSRRLVLESWLPIEIVSVEVTGTPPLSVPTWNKTRSYQKGGKDLYLLSQYNETQFSSIWEGPADNESPLSFKQLFLELDKLYALGVQLQGTIGNYVLRVEPLEYFYLQPSILRLQGVMNIKSRFEFNKNYNQVQLASNASCGVIRFNTATDSFTVTSGSVTLSGPTSPFREGQYIVVAQSGEVLKIQTITSSLSMDVYEAPTVSVADATLFEGEYQVLNNGPSLLNSSTSAYIDATCIGETLDLSNEFVTDIEQHGDQTSLSPAFADRNLSATNKPDLFCFLQCGDGLITTKQYKYMLNNGGDIYERWAFNGHMTNHHKIINNYIRLKNDFYVNAANNTEFSGQALRFRNDAEVRPSATHEFEYFLSFNEMLSLISDPQFTVEVDIKNDGHFEKCWLFEVRMNVNTKKTKFVVYN